ncbi:MAG: ATP-binding cassette domain-containing protein [Paludibacteraceae bacterium]|nr:ATP-binding cassette domain-containing protein [Paludibacteraceae bacterium]
MLKIKNISKSYGAQKVLCAINQEFGVGRIVGLLGPNGAGKSTLMKIVTGYIAADEGEVLIDGKRVAVDDVETKRLVGYLPEHNPLYLDMYVREYLDFVAEVYGLKGVQKRDAVEGVVERTGLTLEANKKIGQLSKGYRQRVGIAAAIIHNPKVLILDEPTTGLDPNQLIEIRQLIKDLGRDRLVIFSTHIMQEVEQVCDDVIVINKGNVIEQGTKDDLVAKYGSIERIFYSMRNEELGMRNE